VVVSNAEAKTKEQMPAVIATAARLPPGCNLQECGRPADRATPSASNACCLSERVPRPYRLRIARSHRLDSSLRAVAQHRLFTVVRSKLIELR
jgi:hypothetical protein